MKGHKPIKIVLVTLVMFFSSCVQQGTQRYEQVELIRVVDGDTILIERGQGGEYVRMIGIDAPESVHPDPTRNSEEGRLASAFLHRLLKDVATVYIVQDVSETDQYGRLLRYVWLTKPSSESTSEIRKSMVNAILLLEGFATNVTIQPDVAYAKHFLDFVREARNLNAGLWGK